MAAYAVIKEGTASLWSAPKEGAERVDEALCGTGAEILESSGAYRRIRTAYQYEGWVLERALEPLVSPKNWEDANKVVVRALFADVQVAPSVRTPCLCTLPRGALVCRENTAADGWQGVALPDGRPGFLPAAALCELPHGIAGQSQARFRNSVVRTALSYLGVPYRWGGKTPAGIDCSGLCFMAYQLNGVTIFRDARIEPGFPIHQIPFRRAGPGDLLYFPGHVAMLIGGGRYVHATAGNGCHGVVVNSLNARSREYRADLPAKLLAVGSLF